VGWLRRKGDINEREARSASQAQCAQPGPRRRPPVHRAPGRRGVPPRGRPVPHLLRRGGGGPLGPQDRGDHPDGPSRRVGRALPRGSSTRRSKTRAGTTRPPSWWRFPRQAARPPIPRHDPGLRLRDPEARRRQPSLPGRPGVCRGAHGARLHPVRDLRLSRHGARGRRPHGVSGEVWSVDDECLAAWTCSRARPRDSTPGKPCRSAPGARREAFFVPRTGCRPPPRSGTGLCRCRSSRTRSRSSCWKPGQGRPPRG
jgi:hypothetical protein